jgi:hypothetical protein
VRTLIRLVFAIILLPAIFTNGCDENAIVDPEDHGMPPTADIVVPDLTEDIIFGFGRTVYVESEELWVSFTDVIGDSRCPMDAYCLWPGQAEIELMLEKRGGCNEPIVVVLQPGWSPIGEPIFFECALGYKVIFLGLSPYPMSGHTIPDEEYVAWIRLEPDRNCCPEEEVCFTWVSPYLLQRDPFVLNEATLEGDELTVQVSYGGGCREHGFKLYMQPAFAESNPVRANLYLSHNDNDDPCDAWITEDLTFDVRRVTELYYYYYGGYGDIILEIFGYFTDQPGEGIEVLYSP